MHLLNRIKRALIPESGRSAIVQSPISSGHTVLDHVNQDALNGWNDAAVAERQHQAFAPILQELRDGRPRLDFVVAARAVEATGAADPLIIEIGCGSGYYSEALPLLLGRQVRYLGVDRSESMTSLGHRVYPQAQFVTADACRLPFAANSCDILLSGTSLMHIADYRIAISESVRASRRWCIFHTVPVMVDRSTTLLKKQAYGEDVVEVIFNRKDLEALFEENGLTTEAVFESIPYDVSSVVGERTCTLTYLCKRR